MLHEGVNQTFSIGFTRPELLRSETLVVVVEQPRVEERGVKLGPEDPVCCLALQFSTCACTVR